MSTQDDDQVVNERFKAIWNAALKQYEEDTGHDLTRFSQTQDYGLDALSTKILNEGKNFDQTRVGNERLNKTRRALKACIQPLDALSNVASTAISSTPYAPAAMVLGAGMYLIKACEYISQAYDHVAILLEQCKEYLDQLGIKLEHEMDSIFQAKAIAILRFMLEVFAEYEKLIKRKENREALKRAKTFVKTAILGERPDEILKEKLARLERHFAQEERLSIAMIYNKSQGIGSNVNKLIAAHNRTKVKAVAESLPEPSYIMAAKQNHNKNSSQSPPEWVFQDQSFRHWMQGTSAKERMLWGLGKTGSGKTSLVSYLAERKFQKTPESKDHPHGKDLEPQDTGARVAHTAVALYYGDYKIKSEQRPDLVFQSLIRQLLRQLWPLDHVLAERHCEQIERLTGMIDESDDDSTEDPSWMSILDNLIGDFPRTFIVIDALDDQEDDYEDFMMGLGSLKSPSLKLFVTSRNMQSMCEDARHRQAIVMNIEAKPHRIEAYVRTRLARIKARDESRETGEWVKPSILPSILDNEQQFEDIVQVILSHAKNNYYRPEYQILSLKRAQKPEDFQRRFDALSEDLGDVIQLDVNMIDLQTDAYKRQIGRHALMLATHAERALAIIEMRHAVVLLLHPETRYNPSLHRRKVEGLTTDLLQESTCRILVVDENESTTSIDDATKDYCKTANVFDRAHRDIAEICLVYLDSRFFSLRCTSKAQYLCRLEQYPFYNYAASYWGDHVREAGERLFLKPSSPVLMTTLLNRKLFLNNEAVALRGKLRPLRLWGWGQRDSWKDLEELEDPIILPLHLLVYFNLPNMVNWWLQHRPEDVDRKSSVGTTALYLACLLGRVRIVELLLFDYGASPVLKGASPSGYNLAAAVFSQSSEVVERLLHFNARELLEQTNAHGRRPLGEAVKLGNAEITQLLLNASLASAGESSLAHGERDGWTALHEAATVSHSSNTIKLLVQTQGGKSLLHKKTVEWQDTPLHLAALRGHTDTVQALLEAGADPHARQSQGKTPLMLAVSGTFNTNQHVIRALLRWSEDHDLKDSHLVDNDGNTTWHLSVYQGRPRIIELLIAKTPESLFNSKAKDGRTPVRRAIEGMAQRRSGGFMHCIDILLRDCPNTIATDDAHAVLNALIPIKDRETTVLPALEKLLNQDVVSWPQLPGNTTILHKAVREGSFEVMKLVWRRYGSEELLKHGDGNGATPLILAANVSAVSKSIFLLERGADPNAQDKSGRTTLHYAIERDLPDLVRDLLARKVNVQLKDRNDSTALERASAHNSCLRLPRVEELHRVSSVHTERAVLEIRTQKPFCVVSGPAMRDLQVHQGIPRQSIAIRHAEILHSDSVPPEAKLPITHVELSITWHVSEDNQDRDAALSISLAKTDGEHTQCKLLTSSDELNRGRQKRTRTVICRLDRELPEEQHQGIAKETLQDLCDLVRRLSVGDSLCINLDVHGAGRTAFIDDAVIRLFYEA